MGTGETAHASREQQQQQQPSIGGRQEENRPPAIVATHPVAAPPPVGRGRRTTTPAWMMRGSALVVGGLQEMSGVQQGEGMPLMTAATRLVLIPPSVGRGGRITSPAWTRAGTRGSAPTPGGLQRQESRRPVPVGRGSGRPSRHGLPWGRAKQPIRQGGYSSNSKRRWARQEEDNPTCDSRDIPRGGSAAGGTRKADDHSRVDDEEVSPRDGLVAGDEWGAAK